MSLLSSAGREIAQWRQFFIRTRGTEAARTRHRPEGADTDFDATEWSNTEWSDTRPETLALTCPIDPETSR